MSVLSIRNLPDDVLFHIFSYAITSISSALNFYCIMRDADKFMLERMRPHLKKLLDQLKTTLKYDPEDPFWVNFEYRVPLYAAPDSREMYYSVETHIGRCFLKPASKKQLQRVLYHIAENYDHFRFLTDIAAVYSPGADNVTFADFKTAPFGVFKESQFLLRCFHEFAWRNLHSPELFWLVSFLSFGWSESVKTFFVRSNTKYLNQFVKTFGDIWQISMGSQIRKRFEIVQSTFGTRPLFNSPYRYAFELRLKVIEYLDCLSFLINSLLCAVPLYPHVLFFASNADMITFIFLMGAYAFTSVVSGMLFYPYWIVIRFVDYLVALLLSRFFINQTQ